MTWAAAWIAATSRRQPAMGLSARRLPRSPRRRLRRGRLALAFCGCLAAAVPAACADESFLLQPGVVASNQPTALYAMRPGGGVEAVDPVSGKVVWHTPLAARPLLVSDGLLLAQQEPQSPTENVVRLALVHTQPTPTIAREWAIKLTGAAVARIDEAPDQKFELEAHSRSEAIFVSWRWTKRYAGGALPAGAPIPDDVVEQGCVRLTPAREPTTAETLAECPMPEKAALPDPLRAMVQARALATPPQLLGGMFVATALDLSLTPARVVLRRWDAHTGEESPSRTLDEGQVVAQLVAADGRHVLVVTRRSAPAAAETYRWALYDLAQGSRRGVLVRSNSAAPFWVADDVVVSLAPPSESRTGDRWVGLPLRLIGIDLATGAEKWAHPIRDSSSETELPPRP